MIEDDDRNLQALAAARPDAVTRAYQPLRDDAVPKWIMERARKQHRTQIGVLDKGQHFAARLLQCRHQRRFWQWLDRLAGQ